MLTSCCFNYHIRVPTQTGKPGTMGRHFPVRENHTKYWKIQGFSDKFFCYFLVLFKLPVYDLLKWIKVSIRKNKTLKRIMENGTKYWKSQGILSVQKSGNHAYYRITINKISCPAVRDFGLKA